MEFTPFQTHDLEPLKNLLWINIYCIVIPNKQKVKHNQ